MISRAADAGSVCTLGDPAPEVLRQQRRSIAEHVVWVEPLPTGQSVGECLTAVDQNLHHRPIGPIVEHEEAQLKRGHMPHRTIHSRGASRCTQARRWATITIVTRSRQDQKVSAHQRKTFFVKLWSVPRPSSVPA